MKYNLKASLVFAFLLALVWLFALNVLAQTAPPAPQTQDTTKQTAKKAEEKPRIEGLSEFHEIMAELWHNALPNKDYKAIREAAPALVEKKNIVMKGKLPEAFQTRADQFNKQRKVFGEAVDSLAKLAWGKDDEILAKGLEDMHTAFEKLARSLYTPIPELEEMHKVIYPLWHTSYEKKDFKTIRENATALKEKMGALMKADLSKLKKEKKETFTKLRADLQKTVEEFGAVAKKGDDKELEKAFVKMHSVFHSLNEEF
jgi:hypothetical protein